MISVQNIAKSFGENTVLKDVSLFVNEASIYGLIGHNGAGKTTLMSIMAGLSKADRGSYDYGGKRIRGAAQDRQRKSFSGKWV